VTRRIAQRILSPAIKERVVRKAASDGRQLSKVLEALQVLAADAGLPEACGLVANITKVKARAKEALARLKAVEEDGWREVLRG